MTKAWLGGNSNRLSDIFLTFYILSDILSNIYFGILADTYFDILLDIYPGIPSDIYFVVLFGIYSCILSSA